MTGSTTASCGCKLKDGDDGTEVIYWGETCDAVDGFRPCVNYATFCRACAQEARAWPEFLPSHEAAEEWMSRQS